MSLTNRDNYTPSKPLASSLAESLLAASVTDFGKIVAYQTCGSTMEEAQILLTNTGSDKLERYCATVEANNNLIVVSKEQTLGKGRDGRVFLSQKDFGIWATFCMDFDMNEVSIDGLSLAIGVGLVEELAQLGLEIGLKWPNDLVVVESDGKLSKLCGILIETSLRTNALSSLRIGVGLNLRASSSHEFKSVGLSELLESSRDQPLSYEEGFTLLTRSIAKAWTEFKLGGIEAFLTRWEKHSIMHGKQISFIRDGKNESGVVVGLDNHGALLVRYSNGYTVNIHSGEVRLLDVARN